jgi:hypothetical protein
MSTTPLSAGMQAVAGPGRSTPITATDIILQASAATFFQIGNSAVSCTNGTDGHYLAAGVLMPIRIPQGSYIYSTAGTLYISPQG